MRCWTLSVICSRMNRRADPRVQRTRRALIDAFIGSALDGDASKLNVRELTRRAKVGRSTFYGHFEGLNELVSESMGNIVTILAAMPVGAVAGESVVQLLEHFWANRRLARRMMSPPMRHLLFNALSSALEERLQAYCRRRHMKPALPLNLAARYLADMEISLLDSWLSGEHRSKIRLHAEALRATAQAAAAALLGVR